MTYSEHCDSLEWLKQTALQSQSKGDGNVLTLNPSIGSGYVKQIQIEKGFNFNITDLLPVQKIPFHQQATNASRLIIKLYLPDLHYSITVQNGAYPIMVNEPGITILHRITRLIPLSGRTVGSECWHLFCLLNG